MMERAENWSASCKQGNMYRPDWIKNPIIASNEILSIDKLIEVFDKDIHNLR
jgi:hypothetical protein